MLVRQEEWERWERLVVEGGQRHMTRSCAISKLVDAEQRCSDVSICRHTSAYVSIRQHMSAYVSICAISKLVDAELRCTSV